MIEAQPFGSFNVGPVGQTQASMVGPEPSVESQTRHGLIALVCQAMMQCHASAQTGTFGVRSKPVDGRCTQGFAAVVPFAGKMFGLGINDAIQDSMQHLVS